MKINWNGLSRKSWSFFWKYYLSVKKFIYIDISDVMFLGVSPLFRIHWVWNENVTLSLDWFWPFFQRCSVSDLPKLIRQISTLTVINERAHRAIKIFTDFPHHECLRPFIFRLRISAYEDPRIPRTYAVHHYDRVATEWKQRKYTPPKRLSINI